MELLLCGLIRDIQRAPFDSEERELHNPETSLPAGSGETPATDCRIIAALAAWSEETDQTEIETFVTERRGPGFCRTRGHAP
jgi:hypothetical protein